MAERGAVEQGGAAGSRPPSGHARTGTARDLRSRAVVVLLAAVAVAAGLPAPVVAPLTAVAAAVTVERMVRRPGRSGLDALVLGTGGLLVALIGAGFLLDVTPGGLTRASWAGATGLAALAGLATCRRRPPPDYPALSGRRVAREGWYALAALLVVVAVTVSVRATDRAERPPLALSAGTSIAGAADLTVTAGPRGGRYDLVVDDGRGSPSLQGPFTLAPGRSAHHPLRVPSGERVTVSLVAAGASQPLRSLVLQGPGPLGGTAAPDARPATGPPPAGG